MFKNSFIVLILSFSICAFGGGGTVNENGGGLVELQFVTLWQSRIQYVKPCLAAAATCGLNDLESTTLRNMITNSSAEKELIFASAQTNPSFFSTSYFSNIIGTTSKLGSQIYINSDLLYPSGVGMRLTNALQSLIGTWSLHNGFGSGAAFTMGQKVSQFWNRSWQSFNLNAFGNKDITLEIFQQTEVSVILFDETQGQDIAKRLKNQLPCTPGLDPFQLRKIKNGNWAQFQSLASKAQALFTGDLSYSCGKGNQLAEIWSGHFQLWISFVRVEGHLSLDLGSLQIQPQNLVRSSP